MTAQHQSTLERLAQNQANAGFEILAAGTREQIARRLTAEVLSTGHVSCCIEHPRHGDFAIRVMPNGPQVQRGIEEMLRAFTAAEFEIWREAVA